MEQTLYALGDLYIINLFIIFFNDINKYTFSKPNLTVILLKYRL